MVYVPLKNTGTTSKEQDKLAAWEFSRKLFRLSRPEAVDDPRNVLQYSIPIETTPSTELITDLNTGINFWCAFFFPTNWSIQVYPDAFAELQDLLGSMTYPLTPEEEQLYYEKVDLGDIFNPSVELPASMAAVQVDRARLINLEFFPSNFNELTQSELASDRFPGIGSTLAEAIVLERAIAPFADPQDVTARVSGVGLTIEQMLVDKVSKRKLYFDVI